jgi:hypothetical protein
MSTRNYNKHTVSTTQPPTGNPGDEWYNPNTNFLYKLFVNSGTTLTWQQIPSTNVTGTAGSVSSASSSGAVTIIAVTDETSNVTVSSSRMSFRAPVAMALSATPRASLATASSSGLVTCDIKLNGTSILNAVNKLSIDANELTSVTAATPTSLVTTAIPDDGLITIDITSAGTGAKGLKITFYS